MSKLIDTAKRLAAEEEGATMVEYGIMVALITAVSIAIIGSLGIKASTTLFQSVDGQLP